MTFHLPEPAADFALGDSAKEKKSPTMVWVTPVIQTLPRLSELTLQSPGPIPGGGGTGGGGSTVIP